MKGIIIDTIHNGDAIPGVALRTSQRKKVQKSKMGVRKFFERMGSQEDMKIERDRMVVENFFKQKDKVESKCLDVWYELVKTYGKKEAKNRIERWGTRNSRRGCKHSSELIARPTDEVHPGEL